MPFDVFIAPVQCPSCQDHRDAVIQTHIRGISADGSALGIGFELDAFDLESGNLLGNGYALVREPGLDEPLRLLERWTCSNCNTEQWAVVEIVDEKVCSIEPAVLDRATLESVNFISEINALVVADRLRGEQLAAGDDPVAELRIRLPNW